MSRRIAVIAFFSVLVPLVAPTPVVATSDSISVEITGHGWGHGRGMGQYGAQGYALDEGWTSAQILDHFYGDTVAGPIPASAPVDPAAVRVELRSQRGSALAADVADGKIHVRDPSGNVLWAADGADEDVDVPGAGVRLTPVAGGIRLEQAPTCAGPWTEVFTVDFDFLEIAPTSADPGPGGLLRVCYADSSATWYDGTLRLNDQPEGPRTTNVVSIEQYLRGVLPAEVPSSWEPAALESQAVAARSYAMAGDTRQQPYGDTCDTTLCQVYRGRYRHTSATGFVSSTNPATDAAIDTTAGLVRIRNGGVARTEFSSSTGGHTAGGDFPAVVDNGDDVASNPNHNWSKVVDLAGFVSGQGKGDIVSVEHTRNGLGEDGGRVLSVTFTFTNGTTTLTGNEARRQFSLKSDWFTFGEIGGPAANADDHYIIAIFNLFLERNPTAAERNTWMAAFESGQPKTDLTGSLAGSDEWAGVMIDDLYQIVLGRSSDSGGRAYWLGQMADGLRFEDVAANFYGAPEYFDRVGGTNTAFVTSLYENILGRSAEQDGLDFWVGLLDAGEVTPYEVTTGFYASPESRLDRVESLYQRILGRSPDASGHEYWADQLLSVDDVSLAAGLAASDEFYQRAQPS